MSTANAIEITDASTFEKWWKYRNLPSDRQLRDAAVAAGLITHGDRIGHLVVGPISSLFNRTADTFASDAYLSAAALWPP